MYPRRPAFWLVGLSAALALLVASCTTPTAPATAPAAVLKTTAPATPATAGEISVHFIAVGQGDCTLVVFPNGKRLLVDCGSTDGPFDAALVRDYIRRQLAPTNPKIDLLVITHPDADHYNKLAAVLGQPEAPAIQVDRVMHIGSVDDHSVANTDDWLRAFLPGRRTAITDQSFNVYPPRDLPGFSAEGVKVLAANVQAAESPANARSIVLKISHGQFDVMITGDATRATDSSILDRFRGHIGELDVEVWKGAHHGSWATATQNSTWADAVKPEAVVFSASATNTYGHPTATWPTCSRPTRGRWLATNSSCGTVQANGPMRPRWAPSRPRPCISPRRTERSSSGRMGRRSGRS